MKVALTVAALLLANTSVASQALTYRISLEDASGEWHSLADYRGKTLLIDTVGATCAWTDKEQPALLELYRELHAKGLEIVSVVEGAATPEQMRAYSQRNKIPWKVLRSDDVSFASVFAPGRRTS